MNYMLIVIWFLLAQAFLLSLAQGQAEGLRNNVSSKRGRGEKRKEIWVAHVEWKERGKHTQYGWGRLGIGKSEMEGVGEWPTGWLWEEGDWDGLSSSSSTSLALEPLGPWFSGSAAGVTPFDTSVASREHSGAQPTSSAAQQSPSVLLWEACHAGPTSQTPVTTHQTAPVPRYQL